AKPTIVIDSPVFPAGTRATKSAAKNWTVPTPKTAPTIRINAVIDNAVTGVSAPEAMGSATAFGVSRPATTKVKAPASTTARMKSNSVLTRNHAPEFVLAAWRIRGESQKWILGSVPLLVAGSSAGQVIRQHR